MINQMNQNDHTPNKFSDAMKELKITNYNFTSEIEADFELPLLHIGHIYARNG